MIIKTKNFQNFLSKPENVYAQVVHYVFLEQTPFLTKVILKKRLYLQKVILSVCSFVRTSVRPSIRHYVKRR